MMVLVAHRYIDVAQLQQYGAFQSVFMTVKKYQSFMVNLKWRLLKILPWT